MSTRMKVKKGDLVQMLTGKDRGKQGRVIEARPNDRRVIVENLNIQTKHVKPRPIQSASRMGGTQMSEGGRVKSPAAISVSNVMVVCPVCKRPTRTGIKITEVKGDVRKVRVCRRADCGEEIDR